MTMLSTRAFVGGLLAVTLVAGCAGPAPSPIHRTGTAEPPARATPTPEVFGVIDVKAVGGRFEPSLVQVPRPGRYQVNLTHGGLVAHNLNFPDGTTIVAGQSSSGTGFIEVPAGGIRFWCSLPGHTEVGFIEVAASSPTTSG